MKIVIHALFRSRRAFLSARLSLCFRFAISAFAAKFLELKVDNDLTE
jgi:hypothetical protein